MQKENLKHKIRTLEIDGDWRFVLKAGVNIFEFKTFKVNGDKYKVFGGFGLALRVFHKFQSDDDIVGEFIDALKGLDLTLEDVRFISPQHFA